MSKQPKKYRKKKSEFDSPWKAIIDLYFKDFMALCWPEKHAIIDGSLKISVGDFWNWKPPKLVI